MVEWESALVEKGRTYDALQISKECGTTTTIFDAGTMVVGFVAIVGIGLLHYLCDSINNDLQTDKKLCHSTLPFATKFAQESCYSMSVSILLEWLGRPKSLEPKVEWLNV